jgi:two-component system, OmpR family, alkaline phosphatase synthesis response regulator PhoP
MSDAQRLILVVEDDEDMLFGVRHNLEYEGYRTAAATTGRDALQKVAKLAPDLVILDVMLPEMNGFDVLRELRVTHARLPVILLTSKSLESDKLQGFQLGADDYVTKPFSIQELLARVQAVLKRSAPESIDEPALQIGALTVDFRRREVTRAGVPLVLALKEYDLLRLFLRNRGQVVTREQLLHEVWGYDPDNVPATRTVDNHVAKLRQKIGPELIETVPKVGYRFCG